MPQVFPTALCVIIAATCVAALLPATALAHAYLLSPVPRNPQVANKVGPCGVARTNSPTSLAAVASARHSFAFARASSGVSRFGEPSFAGITLLT